MLRLAARVPRLRAPFTSTLGVLQGYPPKASRFNKSEGKGMKDHPFDMTEINASMDLMRTQNEIFQRERDAIYHDRNPVVKAFDALRKYVAEFESGLDEEHEVGARLVTFGQSITFHVHSIGFTKPNLVTFLGLSENGDRVQLIQHVSQLSFLLIAMKKLGPQKQRIGFILEKDA